MLRYNFTAELSEDEDLDRPMHNQNAPQSSSAKSNPSKAKAAAKSNQSRGHVPKSNAPPISRPAPAPRVESGKSEAEWSNLRDPQALKFLQELSHLEELLLKSPRVPLTGKAMVAEDEIIEHLDFIRSRLPAALEVAQSIVNQQEVILSSAEQQAQRQLAAAQQQAFQLSNELGIVDRAKAEATEIHQGVMAECTAARDQLRQEVEQVRRQHLQEMDNIRQQALAEAQEIRRGADEYADRVLQAIDSQLGEIQAKIRRGRQHLSSAATS
jgi:hypothetical protein